LSGEGGVYVRVSSLYVPTSTIVYVGSYVDAAARLYSDDDDDDDEIELCTGR